MPRHRRADRRRAPRATSSAEVAQLAGIDAEPPCWRKRTAPRPGTRVGRLHLPHRQARVHLRRRHPCGGRRPHRQPRDGLHRGRPGHLQPRVRARSARGRAKLYGVEPLITDDYLEVEAAIAELQPELVLGTQMERHIAKRLGMPCAVISAPVHVQDFPARYSPQMGFEGANVLFDTWVHPLMMGLEEHLLHMFRDDFEFHETPRRRTWAGARTAAGRPRPVLRRRRRRGRCRGPARQPLARRPAVGALAAWSAHRLGRPRRCREGAEEDPLLRARQGPPQHRAYAGTAGLPRHHRRDPLRCQSALQPLTRRGRDARPAGCRSGPRVARTPGRGRVRPCAWCWSRWTATWPAPRARQPHAARQLPGLRSACMPPTNGAATSARSSAASRHRPGRHRHRHDAVHGRPLPAGAAGAAARRDHCDAMVCAMSPAR
jgi:hypothetical protein